MTSGVGEFTLGLWRQIKRAGQRLQRCNPALAATTSREGALALTDHTCPLAQCEPPLSGALGEQ